MQKELGNRTLDEFFGEEPTQNFLDAMKEAGIRRVVLGEDIDIDLLEFKGRLPQLAEGLVRALSMLLNSERVTTNLRKRKVEKFSKRHEYIGGLFADVHRALFRFADDNVKRLVAGIAGLRSQSCVQRTQQRRQPSQEHWSFKAPNQGSPLGPPRGGVAQHRAPPTPVTPPHTPAVIPAKAGIQGGGAEQGIPLALHSALCQHPPARE